VVRSPVDHLCLSDYARRLWWPHGVPKTVSVLILSIRAGPVCRDEDDARAKMIQEGLLRNWPGKPRPLTPREPKGVGIMEPL
jgi:hypothetical protein